MTEVTGCYKNIARTRLAQRLDLLAAYGVYQREVRVGSQDRAVRGGGELLTVGRRLNEDACPGCRPDWGNVAKNILAPLSSDEVYAVTSIISGVVRNYLQHYLYSCCKSDKRSGVNLSDSQRLLEIQFARLTGYSGCQSSTNPIDFTLKHLVTLYLAEAKWQTSEVTPSRNCSSGRREDELSLAGTLPGDLDLTFGVDGIVATDPGNAVGAAMFGVVCRRAGGS
jgi:hypothetical protein